MSAPVAIAELSALLGGAAVRAVEPVAGSGTGTAYRAVLQTGAAVFAKRAAGRGAARAEVAGLRWLADAGARVPAVIRAHGDLLVLEWVEAVPPDRAAALRLGRQLAVLHTAGAPAFGSPPPGSEQGWIGALPMSYAAHGDWPSFYAEHRLRPYLSACLRLGRLAPADYDAVARLCDAVGSLAGPEVAPARLHGDLWSGNILWSDTGPLLIDPAAHGGHPESDLAMLALFGAPHLPEVLRGYQQVAALPAGWQRRVPLHQVYPLLVHAVLFGGGYGAAAATAAREAMAR